MDFQNDLIVSHCRTFKLLWSYSILILELENLAGKVGLEPTTIRLTAESSAIELLTNEFSCSSFAARHPVNKVGFTSNIVNLSKAPD